MRNRHGNKHWNIKNTSMLKQENKTQLYSFMSCQKIYQNIEIDIHIQDVYKYTYLIKNWHHVYHMCHIYIYHTYIYIIHMCMMYINAWRTYKRIVKAQVRSIHVLSWTNSKRHTTPESLGSPGRCQHTLRFVFPITQWTS